MNKLMNQCFIPDVKTRVVFLFSASAFIFLSLSSLYGCYEFDNFLCLHCPLSPSRSLPFAESRYPISVHSLKRFCLLSSNEMFPLSIRTNDILPTSYKMCPLSGVFDYAILVDQGYCSLSHVFCLRLLYIQLIVFLPKQITSFPLHLICAFRNAFQCPIFAPLVIL